jgi:tetratricopeptide (TPR) repeat protein
MSNDSVAISGPEFARFADGQFELWLRVKGAAIEHSKYGQGCIVEVEPRNGYIPLIKTRFSSQPDTSTFNSDSFTKGVLTAIHISPELAALFLQWQERLAAEQARIAAEVAEKAARAAAEEAARAEFGALAEKYNVPIEKVGFNSFTSVLLKLGIGASLDADDVRLLERNSAFNVLATYYCQCYKTDSDAWNLVKACSHLRRARLPHKAIEISEHFMNHPLADVRVRAAVLTTRGGAFRDTSELDQAIECANEAIKLSPNSFHPYNLLGAVYYEQGNPAQGDQYFTKALEMGAHRREQEAEIRAALERSAVDARNVIGEYLLQKDPQKYAWVDSYIA